MMSGTLFEQGDIVLVPFPFSNLKEIKQRPVLVLSPLSYNKRSDDIITCGITSNLKDKQCSILIDTVNLSSGFIPVKSRIKVDKLFTLEKTIVKRKLARVNKSTMSKVKREFISLV